MCFSRCSITAVAAGAPLLRPNTVWSCDGVIIHFIDDNEQLGYTQRLGELRMFSSLTAPLKSCFKLALCSTQLWESAR